MWNIINSIVSIRTYSNCTTILLPTSPPPPMLHSLILLSSLLSQLILIGSGVYLTIIWLMWITLAGLIMCSTFSIPVTVFISTNNSIKICSSISLQEFEMKQLNEIWLEICTLIICLGVKTSIYCWYNSSCWKVRMHIAVRQSSLCGPPFLLNEFYNLLPAVSICIQDHELSVECNDTVGVSHPVNHD